MKPSMSLMKLMIKMLILMMLFVIIFFISSLLYSARYWPDIYNYINANITIKRIPTLTELNLTVIEVDYVTESYTTTDFEYVDVSTVDEFDLVELTLDDVEIKNDVKRSILIAKPKDYNELPSRSIFIDYMFLEEPVTTVKEVPDEDLKETDTSSAYTPEQRYEQKSMNYNEATELNNILVSKYIKKDIERVATTEELRSKTYKALNNLEYKDPVHINEILAKQNEKDTVTAADIASYEEAKRILYEELKDHEMVNEENDQKVEISTTKEGYLIGDNVNNIEERNQFDLTILTNDDEEHEYTRIIKDLVDESKLSTRDPKDVEMFTGKPTHMMMVREKKGPTCHGNKTCEDFTTAVYPWLVAIFVKNGSNDQFSYYCDGALVSDTVILTDARCVHTSNKTIDPDHILVFLGKGSLQIMNGDEKVQKLKEIIVHENFTTDGETVNDLALLVMEKPVVFTSAIQIACLREQSEEDVQEAATTAWGLNGELMPIFFNKEKSDYCYDKDDDIFCATYGNNVPLCPSYGGAFAVKSSDKWCLQGIFYGDPAQRGICFTKNVHYTALNNYIQWIDNVISVNKHDL